MDLRPYIASALFILLAAGPLRPADSLLARASLRGLKGVALTIEPTSADARVTGLTDDQIRREVERKLQNAGIPILSDREKAGGAPSLYIDPKINKPPDAPIFSYNVTVSLQQMVTLERNAAIKTISPTWALSRSGLAGERTLSAAVQRATADLVDRFVIDYKAVNK